MNNTTTITQPSSDGEWAFAGYFPPAAQNGLMMDGEWAFATAKMCNQDLSQVEALTDGEWAFALSAVNPETVW